MNQPKRTLAEALDAAESGEEFMQILLSIRPPGEDDEAQS